MNQAGADLTASAEVDFEPHAASAAGRLNWLRAGVLGVDDAIVSVPGIVVGWRARPRLEGRFSQQVWPDLSQERYRWPWASTYQSVASAIVKNALLAQEGRELAESPEQELAELATIYRVKGLSEATANAVAAELKAHDVSAAHLDAARHLDPDDLANPLQAVVASAASFIRGALLPLLAILLPPAGWRVPVTFAVVLVALGIAGAIGAHIGGSPHPPRRAARHHRRRHLTRLHLRRRQPVRYRPRIAHATRRGPAGRNRRRR
jgi:VIT1/CCC1 family predicted Fe2+/Mn2+ transporter